MKPTHRLKVLNKLTNHRTEAGAGWLNKDGSITIRVNPMVNIQDMPEHVITLFPDTSSARPTSAWNEHVNKQTAKGPLIDDEDDPAQYPTDPGVNRDNM
jgi:hypothetical protein